MTAIASLIGVSLPWNGGVSIEWHQHRWSGLLAQAAESAILALEPRLIDAEQSADGDATCPFRTPARLPLQSLDGLTVKVKKTVPFFIVEVRTSEPTSLSAYWFRLPSSSDWIQHEREIKKTTPFLLRGRPRCDGDRIAVVSETVPGRPQVIALYRASEQRGSAELALQSLNQQDVLQLNRFGIAAKLSPDLLDHRNWGGFAQVFLEQAHVLDGVSQNHSVALSDWYWRRVSSVLGISDSLLSKSGQKEFAFEEGSPPLAKDFSPVKNMEALLSRACSELGWNLPARSQTMQTSWAETALSAQDLAAAFERRQQPVRLLNAANGSPSPDSLHNALKAAALSRHLARFENSTTSRLDLQAVAATAASLLTQFDAFNGFVAMASEERALEQRLAILQQEAAGEGLDPRLTAKTNSLRQQVSELETRLGPVFEVRQLISTFDVASLPGECASDAAARTFTSSMQPLQNAWLEARFSAERLAAFRSCPGVGPPVVTARLEDCVPRGEVAAATLVDWLALLGAMSRLQRDIVSLREWRAAHSRWLLSDARQQGASLFRNSSRADALVAQVEVAVSSIDLALYDLLFEVAREQSKIDDFFRQELLSHPSIVRFVLSEDAGARDVSADVADARPMLFNLLEASQRVPASRTECVQTLETLNASSSIMGARRWYGESLKMKLHATWRYRVQTAVRAIERAGLRYQQEDLEVLWSNVGRGLSSLDPAIVHILRSTGCLPSERGSELLDKLWPS